MFEVFYRAGLRLQLEAINKFVYLLNSHNFAHDWCNVALTLEVSDNHAAGDLHRHLGVSLIPLRFDVDQFVTAIEVL